MLILKCDRDLEMRRVHGACPLRGTQTYSNLQSLDSDWSSSREYNKLTAYTGTLRLAKQHGMAFRVVATELSLPLSRELLFPTPSTFGTPHRPEQGRDLATLNHCWN